LSYKIPPLPPTLGEKQKAKTPVTQIFRQCADAEEHPKEGKLTVQKPFNFETSKRMRVQ